MVDIQSVATEISEEKKKIEEERRKKKETTGQNIMAPLLHRAAINTRISWHGKRQHLKTVT